MTRDDLKLYTDEDLRHLTDIRFWSPADLARLAERRLWELREQLGKERPWLKDHLLNGPKPPEKLNWRDEDAARAKDAAREAIELLVKAAERADAAVVLAQNAGGFED